MLEMYIIFLFVRCRVKLVMSGVQCCLILVSVISSFFSVVKCSRRGLSKEGENWLFKMAMVLARSPLAVWPGVTGIIAIVIGGWDGQRSCPQGLFSRIIPRPKGIECGFLWDFRRIE